MSQIETTSAIKKYRERCEDRVDVIQTHQRTVIVVADGAGGTGSGDLAAEFVVREVQSNYSTIHSANEWADFLRETDKQIRIGESTAVVVDVRPFGIAGASVGDSCAWIINDGKITDLTNNQIRKPLLGSGICQPVGFTHSSLVGLLITATDGFFDYAKRDEITRLVGQTEFFKISRKCIELVQLPSGDLWDDVGIVVARNKPQQRNRTKYKI
jgi:serine/threonine protein phosphatase PrpC